MKNNLLNPTKTQIKQRNQLWAEALIKNKKKATGGMYKNGGRCCLAVAQNVAKECGVEIPDDPNDEGYIDKDAFPHQNVIDFFGWDGVNPDLVYPITGGISEYCASDLNDGECFSANGSNGMSHKRIAECVLNTFVHPKKPKWTFTI
jgi:hypothetical protein